MKILNVYIIHTSIDSNYALYKLKDEDIQKIKRIQDQILIIQNAKTMFLETLKGLDNVISQGSYREIEIMYARIFHLLLWEEGKKSDELSPLSDEGINK